MQEILRDFGVCCRDKRDINTPWLRSNSKLMDRSFHGYLRVTELGATPAESWEADSLSPLDSLLSRLCCDSRCRCLQPCQAVGGAVIACTDRKGVLRQRGTKPTRTEGTSPLPPPAADSPETNSTPARREQVRVTATVPTHLYCQM